MMFLHVLTAHANSHAHHTHITRTSHIESAPSNKMIGQKAIAIALSGFNDLGRSVIPIFLLIDHFLFQFSTFSEKMTNIYRLEV